MNLIVICGYNLGLPAPKIIWGKQADRSKIIAGKIFITCGYASRST